MLYLLAADDNGIVSKEKIRGQFDGSLWYLVSAARVWRVGWGGHGSQQQGGLPREGPCVCGWGGGGDRLPVNDATTGCTLASRH